MFKKQREKRKSKSNLLDAHLYEKTTNFKTGSIELTTDEILFQKLTIMNTVCSIPKTNTQSRIVTQKQINSFDFILAVLAKENAVELILAFYRIGKKTIQELYELQLQNKIGKIHFLVNDAIPKLTPDAYNLLKSFENENWTIKLENNHTKIILIKTEQNFYCIEGSGNLSINARIEQYIFDNNQTIFEFHKEWILKL